MTFGSGSFQGTYENHEIPGTKRPFGQTGRQPHFAATDHSGAVVPRAMVRIVNVETGEAGVIGLAKVVRFALQNAASISALMLTTEALVSEIPEKEPPAPAGPPGGGTY